MESVSEPHANCRDESRHGRQKCLRHDHSLAISVTYKLGPKLSGIGRKRLLHSKDQQDTSVGALV